MSSIQIAGDTSGSITLSAPSVAGTNTITLPAVTGTILTTAYTGNVTFSGDLAVDTDTLYVDSTNNRVGIGTSSPAGKLNVVSDIRIDGSNFAGINYYGSSVNLTGVYTGLDSGGGFAVNVRDSGYLALSTSNTERMRIDSSGNVGIGTASPTAKLDLLTSGAANVALFRAGAGQNSFLSVIGNGNSFLSTSFDIVQNSSNEAEIALRANAPMKFYTNNTERMRITSTGNVGIGTSSPLNFGGANLQVQNSTIGSIVWSNGTYIGQLLASASAEVTIGSRSNHPLRLGTNDTERMRIDSSGNVGIGTSSPVAKLDVNGVGAFSAGSASAPSITFRSDTSLNTGIYSPGENQIALSTAGYVRLNISSAGTMVASKYNGTAASPSESADWPTPILALRGYGDFTQESMLSFGYSNDAAYQTGGNVWGFRLNGVASATTSSSSTHLNLAGPGQFYLYSGGDAIFSPGGSEKMRIDSSGNVLVGTTAGTDFKTRIVRTGNQGILRLQNNDTSGLNYDQSQIVIGQAAGAGYMFARYYTSAGGAAQFAFRGDGQMFATSTSISSISDIRTKENIRDSNDGLSTILNLRTVRFDFKEGFGNNRKNQLGFIAQEVESVFPDAVDIATQNDNNGDFYKTVAPGTLIPVLVKAIQELSAKVDALQTEINVLKGE